MHHSTVILCEYKEKDDVDECNEPLQIYCFILYIYNVTLFLSDCLPTNVKICTSSEVNITGVVSSEEELKHLLESHKCASRTTYSIW